jgi:MFS superfamily sulfate permease-like transporter
MSDLQLYSKTDMENARTKGQLIGWAQGAGALMLFMLGMSVIGWIPMLLVIGVLVFLGVKLLGK